MEVSKLTISEETLSPKKMTNRVKSAVVEQRLRELPADDIASAKTRVELAKLLGYTDATIKGGIIKVGRLIREGKIVETLIGKDGNRREYWYRRVSGWEPKRKGYIGKKQAKALQKESESEFKAVYEAAKEAFNNSCRNIEISVGEVTVKIGELPVNTLIELIEKIQK